MERRLIRIQHLERVLKMGSCGGQALEHETDHADPDHRLTVIQSHFIISAKPSRLVKPSEGALDDPSFRQNLEDFRGGCSLWCSIACALRWSQIFPTNYLFVRRR